ncbi:MAG TPA: hypothetical protein VMG12_12445 [Polyangiaceae bacterium]|nr:hypothetical protein [Polyangiaceae bacterium]
MTFVGLAIFSFAYYRYTLVELDAKRNEVLGRQRAVSAAVGTSGFELRDRIEPWVLALADGKLGEQVAPEARLDEVAKGPTIYLRMRQAEAHTVQSLRKAALGSLRDGFTSCLFVGTSLDPEAGLRCTLTSQCGPGEVCSDWNRCAVPEHPYNLKLLYEGLRVLTPEWLQTLEAAKDELQVRAIDLELQAVGKHEAVAAVELVKRSRFFAAVLDEEAPAGSDAAPPLASESRDEQLQAVDHRVRVGIWDLARAAPLAVLNLEAAGRFVRLGGSGAIDTRAQRAQQRQANNCAVATDVRRALAAGRVLAPGEEVAAPELPNPVAGE